MKEYKYNLYYILWRLPQELRDKALFEIPILCGVSRKTFKDWIYIKKDSNREIYQSCLKKIAQYFNVKFDELLNF